MAGGGWRQCGKEDRDGRPCTGIRADHISKPIRPTQRLRLCLAHLGANQLDEVLAQLHPGCEVDLRGTRITGGLLHRILEAVAEDGIHTLRDANFTAAKFDDDADFGNTVFLGTTRFKRALFCRAADFDQVLFDGDIADFSEVQFQRASFRWVRFRGAANFSKTEFHSRVCFAKAHFTGYLDFRGARFYSHIAGEASADFTDAALTAAVHFDGVWCHGRGGLDFSGASFAAADRLGPLGADFLALNRATFGSSVAIEALATEVSCSQARFEAGFAIRLRYARLRLENAVLSAPSSLMGSESGKDPYFDTLADPERLVLDNGELANRIRDDESRPDRALWMPVLSSAQGVDVSELTISDIDLSQTRFSGAYHLDRLRIEGRSRFTEPLRPHPWRGSFRVRWDWPPLWWWTRRQLLVEEAIWRATQRRGADWKALADEAGGSQRAATPEALAAMYRALRKAQEDHKNGPGASDFYYGEMEMRRHTPSASFGERAVLFLYWLTSGYGLRAMRALGCLLVVTSVVTVVMHSIGFADTRVGFGGSALDVVDAALSLQTGSAETHALTWQGELLRILMRLVGPLLLGLMLLSVRNRVKR
ncbi:MAG TPA: pentapeptide repeat-containing protein [Streptosporangiaceae bacterium]